MQNANLIGLSRQMSLRRELEVVSNNIANLNTTGFKADTAIFEELLMPRASADQLPVSGAEYSSRVGSIAGSRARMSISSCRRG